MNLKNCHRLILEIQVLLPAGVSDDPALCWHQFFYKILCIGTVVSDVLQWDYDRTGHDTEHLWHPNNGRIAFSWMLPRPLLPCPLGSPLLRIHCTQQTFAERETFCKKQKKQTAIYGNVWQYGSSTDLDAPRWTLLSLCTCRQVAESLSPSPKQHVCLSFPRTKLAESEAISPSPMHLDCMRVLKKRTTLMTFTLCILLHLFSMCHNFCYAFEQFCLLHVKSLYTGPKKSWHPSLEQNVCAWWGVVALPDKVEILQREDLLANCRCLDSKSPYFALSSCFFLHPTSFLVHGSPHGRRSHINTLLHTEASIPELQEYKVEKRTMTLQLNQLYSILLYF